MQLEKLQKTHGYLVSDRAKFQDVLKRFEARKKHLIDTVAHEKAELGLRSMLYGLLCQNR